MPPVQPGGDLLTDSELTAILAQLLAGAGVGSWPGPYAATDVGIFYGAIDSEPDRAIGITSYLPTDDVVTGLAIRRVQFRFRGARANPAGANDLADATFTVLQGLTRRNGINHAERVSSAQLGVDQNARLERTDNYSITIDNPEA